MKFAVLAGMLLGLMVTASAGEIIDRTVATVNKSLILQSDLELEMRFEAFLDRRPLQTPTATEVKAALQRLINQELLRGELKLAGFRLREDRIPKRIEEIRKEYPEADTDERWRAALARYGLSEVDFQERVVAQLEILRFVDTRLRPNVHVERSAIEEYYREKLLPQLHQAGGKDVPLAKVSAQIEEVLVQQRMDQLLTDWLNNLRQQSTIRTELPVYGPMSATEAGPAEGARNKYPASGAR